MTKITANEYAVVSRLLEEALSLPQDSRADWIERLLGPDAAFKGIMSSLIAATAGVESEDFLGRLPVFDALDSAARPRHLVELAEDTRIGPYLLLRQIGRGGMASVWLARRVDGALNRTVALKLPFADFTGHRFADRSARERDILAALAHPGIARLYDAGVTSAGQPYLAMEFVEGQPITTHCDAHRLTIRQRISLFLGVVDATQYAHIQMVLHRDLKPSNVQVTQSGQVVLLDFGIAKLLTDDEPRDLDLSRFGGGAMTPAYASPEQLTAGKLSAASDVYSLGVILYELLCGQRPYRLKRDTPLALEDAIVETEAVRPSQSIADPAITVLRATTPTVLMHTLKGDLDTILLKSLKKSPADRYQTAQALASDLIRFLEGRPVHARPDSTVYRFQKFLARNRLVASVVTISVLLLLAATAVSLRQAHIAGIEAAHAQHEARKALAVQNFLLELFRTNTDAQVDPVKARQLTARQLLDVGAQRVDSKLHDEPEDQEAIEDTLADMYLALGLDREATRIEGMRIGSLTRAYGANDPRIPAAVLTYAQGVYNTDGYLPALPLLARAEALLDAAGDMTSLTRGQLLVDAARFRLASAPATARHYADQAIEFFKQQPTSDDSLVTAYLYAARSRYALGDFNAAEVAYRRSLVELARLDPAPLATKLTAMVGLAETEAKRGHSSDAERDFRSIFAESRRRNGDAHLDTIQVQTRLGAFLQSTARRNEGRALMLDAIHQIERDPSLNAPNLNLQVYRNWGLALLADGRLQAAAEILQHNASMRRKRDPDTTILAAALRDLGMAETTLGEYAQARELTDEALRLWKSATGAAAAPDAANSYLLAQAQLLLAQGNADDALKKLASVQAASVSSHMPLDIDAVRGKVTASRANLLLNRPGEALRLAGAALDLIQHSTQRSEVDTLESDALAQVGQAQRMAGRAGAGRPSLERAVTLREAADDPSSPWLAAARINLAECLLDLGDRTAARRLQAQAATAISTHPKISTDFLLPLQSLATRIRHLPPLSNADRKTLQSI